jgi:uncharacterized Zn ribbon protein
MDPITTAILAAISAGVVSGTTDVAEQAVVDAYKKLKELLRNKFGAKSKVVKAVKELEANPNSEARKAVVQEELASAKASKDVDLLKAAQTLLKTLKVKSSGDQVLQIATGEQDIQIVGERNTVTVNIPKTKRNN